ncbi:MAG: DUF4292 domain-containing protein [Myxococcota bacterium]
MRSHRSVATGLVVLGLLACPKRIPLPERLKVSGTVELLQRIARARAAVDAFSAEIRLTYFGPKGRRFKGTASLAVLRPKSLRYELQGPHGGVLEAFATNGAELQLFDLENNRFYHGPATPRNFNQLMALVPLGLNGEEWVALLFGEVCIPNHALLAYDDRVGRFIFTWEDQGLARRVEVDAETSRVTRATVHRRDAVGSEINVSEINIRERDERGLPVVLELKGGPGDLSVRVRLRDVSYDVEHEPDVFVLDPPAQVTPEYLGED